MPLSILAVGIRHMHSSQFHVGIFYDYGAGLRISHLAWHLKFKDEEALAGYQLSPVTLDTVSQTIVRAFCRSIAISNSNGAIPYAFRYVPSAIDRSTGTFVADGPGAGFTCATFVMAVFDRMGFPILDEATWGAREEDKAWQKDLLGMLGQDADPEHLQALKDDIGCCRYRPQEVAASASLENWPISFDIASRVGANLARSLTSAHSTGK